LGAIDFSTYKKNHYWKADYTFTKDGIFHGLVGWYTFQLSSKQQMSTRPPLSLHPEIWHQPFIPLKEPIQVKKGEKLQVKFAMYLEATLDGPLWKWDITYKGKKIEQSNFDSVPLSKQLLDKLQVH